MVAGRPAERSAMSEPKIIVRNNGPLRVEGVFQLVDQEGRQFGLGGRSVISLCRCGHSENRPFCDGTHKKICFDSVLEARDLPPKVEPGQRGG